MARHTKLDKMVIAAVALARDGKDPFAAEDLVVKCFELFPEDFCLPGYPQYPHSNAIYTKVMGKSSPLVSRGFLKKTGTQRYRSTSKAAAHVDVIGESHGVTHRSTSREEAVEMARLFGTSAWDLYSAGNHDRITFYMFCRFYNIPARARKWQAISGRISAVSHVIDHAVAIGEAGESLHVPLRGREQVLTSEELREIGALREYLDGAFERELSDWKKRTGAA